ncbi:MAG: hypothetical protein QOE28_1280 [Solirubrobacteraceae bacterium]|nr:hypothetical protein [Solirubrobacteraceae bacterium]
MLAVAALAFSFPAASPAAGVADSVTIVHRPGAWVGEHSPEIYRPSDSQFSLSSSNDHSVVDVRVDDYTLEFGSHRDLEALRPGVYADAGTALFHGDGRPYLNVYGGGEGCNDKSGQFEIRDIAIDGAGTVVRFWATYAFTCEFELFPSLWGEVRIGMPAPDGSTATAPSLVRWPSAYPGYEGQIPAPVDVVGGASGGSVTSVALAGSDADQFAIARDGCTGASLAPDEACRVEVEHHPTRPGTARAWLLVHAAGDRNAVPLQGYALGSRNRVILHSEPGDPAGNGRDYDFEGKDGDLDVLGNRHDVEFRLLTADKDAAWAGGVNAPEGQDLVPGRHYVQPGGADWTATGFAAAGPHGSHCTPWASDFTVNELTFDYANRLKTASVDFSQQCEGASGRLRGTIEWRVGDQTPPAPWTVDGNPPTDDGSPPDDSTPTPSEPATPASSPRSDATPTPGPPVTQDGAAAPPGAAVGATARRVVSVAKRFAKVRGGFAVRRLTLRGLPAGARVRVTCAPRRGCPFATRATLATASGTASLARLFARRTLPRRARIVVSAAGRAYRFRLS